MSKGSCAQPSRRKARCFASGDQRGQTEHSFAVIFFFQAEDGIRDVAVTGVQTCALPIYAKVVGGYFEEWSIYFAGYNIANLQSNGVADKLTHLNYAFGNATANGCAIADEIGRASCRERV